jgi:hypothetical protein
MNDSQTSQVWLTLLTINHPNLPSPLYFCNNYSNITSNGNVFLAIPFEIVFPEDSPDAVGEAKLKVDNVDRVMVDTIRSIASPPTITIQVVLASQPDTIEVQLDSLTMRNVEYDAASIRGTLRFEDVATEPITLTMTPSRFPAMF